MRSRTVAGGILAFAAAGLAALYVVASVVGALGALVLGLLMVLHLV